MKRLAVRVLAAGVLGISIIVAAPLSSLVIAQDRAVSVLKKNDRNGDDKVSRDEWRGPSSAFKAIDSNGDDFLSLEELRTRFGSNGGKIGGDPAGSKIPGGTGGIPSAAPVMWIDVHAHTPGKQYTDFLSGVGAAAEAIEGSSISKMILMPTPQSDYDNNWTLDDFVSLAKSKPGLFAVMGGGGSLNPMIHDESPDGTVSDALRKRFARKAEEILQQGAVGFGEMSILHLSLVQGHRYASVPGDHPLFLLLADIAANNDVPIDMHFDPVVEDLETPDWLSSSRNPSTLKRNIDGFERLLEHNRKARIVWAHAGSDNVGHWTVQLTRRLLAKHPNLYMSLRMTPGIGKVMRNHPLDPGGIKQPWLKVFKDFPDRFVIGGDQFFTAYQPGTRSPGSVFAENAGNIRQRATMFLTWLPEELAREIGYENAVRIYKLKR